LFNRVRISAYDLEPHRLDSHLRRIHKHRPTHFFGYPSALYDFAIQMYHRGLDLKRLNLKAVFLTSEPVRAHQRAIIEEVTGSPCAEFYGSAEGGLTAFQCPEGSLHINSEAAWVDIPDPSTREILVTDLMLRAFPLIKYRIGDEVTAKSGKCACGRAHPMLDQIEGRCGDPIRLPNGRWLNANVPSYIFKQFAGLKTIRRYRFVHMADNRLELQLVVTPGVTDRQLDLVEAEVRRAFGDDVPFTTKIVDALPHLDNAKHRDYVRLGKSDEIPPGEMAPVGVVRKF
jgi:phenylacetate-CoA ligase